jgi:hypothetical protein
MKELYDYLKHLRAEMLPFSTEEINEILLTVYNIVEWAIRDQCSVIEISPRRVSWSKQNDGETVGEFSTPVSFKPHFQLIVGRDLMLQTHLQMMEETLTGAKYRIV